MERKTPRFRRRFESFAKKPSTALSQEQEVGTKWKVKRSWRPSQARTLACLVGGVVVEDHMDALAGRDIGLDGVEEADELLVAVALHAAPDDLALEHVEGGRTGWSCHAACSRGSWCQDGPFHRQAGLGAVERLDLRLFVDREHDGVGRRVDVEPDHIAQLGDEVGIVRKLELPHPMGPKPVCAPDALHRADTDAGRLGHHGGDPVGRLGGRVAQRQGDHPLGHLRAERVDARWPCLVAQQTVVALLGEALLPAPDAGLRLAGPPGSQNWKALAAAVSRNCSTRARRSCPASPRRRFETLGAVFANAPLPSRST